MQVYGTSLKDVIHEKFGDGIMSAIDFEVDVAKQAHPQGDRVVVTGGDSEREVSALPSLVRQGEQLPPQGR